MQTCPKLRALEEQEHDDSKRGPRDSPRTPAGDGEKLEKLRAISAKLSPPANIPPLPGSGSSKGEAEAAVPQTQDQKLDALMNMMQKVAVKDDLERMRTTLIKDVETNTKVAISEAVDPLKAELHDLQSRVQLLEMKPSEPAQHEGGLGMPGAFQSQMSKLEKEFQELKEYWSSPGSNRPNDDVGCTAVVGGLATLLNFDAAKNWVYNKLWELHGPITKDIYPKGDFKNIVFVKFSTKGECDKAIQLLRQAQCKEGGNDVWAKPEKPLEVRVLRSIVFGTKHDMTNFYPKKVLRGDVDEDDKRGELWLGDDKVFMVSIEGQSLKITFEPGWQDWLSHKDFPEFQKTVDAQNGKLSSSSGPVKGLGKGKTISKGSKRGGNGGRG